MALFNLHHSPIFSLNHKALNPFLPKPKPIQFSLHRQSYTTHEDEDEEQVIGDCLVFEEGIFEEPHLLLQNEFPKPFNNNTKIKSEEDLIPENWKEAQAEINITKKDRRKLAQQLEFGSRLERRKQGLKPIPTGYANAKQYKAAKLRELKPLVLDNPQFFLPTEGEGEVAVDEGSRVAPKNPKMAVYAILGRSFDDISRFFNSGMYDPDAAKDPQGSPKLFTKEEKFLMNRRNPDLATATSDKWQPLHTLAASGEFYLVDTLLKHGVDVNAPNQEGLSAIHKAILGKKHAICNYLLRNSANPFVRDKDGATLMHYAVRTASTQMMKVLLLYNVDINLQDNDGWTPLHLAIQSRRTDMVRLLLIKGADRTLKNQDGFTPLDLCLHSGRDTRTYDLIRLLKQPPRPRKE